MKIPNVNYTCPKCGREIAIDTDMSIERCLCGRKIDSAVKKYFIGEKVNADKCQENILKLLKGFLNS